VAPVLTNTCAQCHNERLASGGLNVAGLVNRESIVSHREEWDRILRRVRAGEMPPPSVPRLPESIVAAFVNAAQRIRAASPLEG
jgi:hypothetical protein